MLYWLIGLAQSTPLLTLVDSNGQIDYAKHAKNYPHQDWVDSLANEDIPNEPNAEMAFWINTYNSLTIHVVLNAYPIDSIKDIDGGNVWDTQRFQVGTEMLTLNEIEHGKLKAFNDPRTHAALNCASIGCPKLFNKPYLASTLDSQLDEAARKWIAHNAFGYHDGWFSNTLYINAIFDWYAFDFPNNTNGFNNDRIPEKYKGAAQFIAQYGNDSVRAKLANTTTVEIQPYNWSLNQR